MLGVYRPNHDHWNHEFVVLDQPPYGFVPDTYADDMANLWFPRWYDPQMEENAQRLPEHLRTGEPAIVLQRVWVEKYDAIHAAEHVGRFALANWLSLAVHNFLVFEKSQIRIVREGVADL